MNLLKDQIFTLTDGSKVSLPQIFSAMGQGKINGFAALRPHQRPAWHMFLVQLAALSLWSSGIKGVANSTDDWSAILRGLTKEYEDDAPWQLTAADSSRPAFLQPPAPEGLKWSKVLTPDNLDMLITARNHDVKQSIAQHSAPEDWIYALISLQTCEGFGGRGNYGIARMNGGSSSRPLLGLAPAKGQKDLSVNPSAWWARDVGCLLSTRSGKEDTILGTIGGPALLWCITWPEGEQLELDDLDPWFIEVCRRVRMVNHGGSLSARRGTSKAARTNSKSFKGNIGDPWSPVEKKAGKSLTLGNGDFDYNHLYSLLFTGNWEKPILCKPQGNEHGDMLLVAEAFSRGNSKTEGFKSRVVPVPGLILSAFSSETVGTLAKAQMEEVKAFDNSLKNAIALLAAGGERDRVKKEHYSRSFYARKRFSAKVDNLFFPSLWHRFEAMNTSPEEEETAKVKFIQKLWHAVEQEFRKTITSVPCNYILRPRAEVRAKRALRNHVLKHFHFPYLLEKGEPQ